MSSSSYYWKSFVLRFVFPTFLTIFLFITSIFFFIIPTIEENNMSHKREMISELTNSAWNILAKFENDEKLGILNREEAQKQAISQIRNLHYGQQMKDYFWVNDMYPRMIIHPYRIDLNGKDLTNLTDSNGKYIFREIVKIVKEHESGYIEYKWQWMDNENIIVPKISYVKGFTPWGWIIGTGVYIEDIKAEISIITNKEIKISLVILLIITLLLIYVIIQSHKNEEKRNIAENNLRNSEEKFRTLTNNLNIGVFRRPISGKAKFIEVNPTVVELFGYSNKDEFLKTPIEKLYVDQLEQKRIWSKTFANGFIKNELAMLKKKNGDTFIGSLNAVLIKNEKGKAQFFDGIIEDVTNSKIKEEKQNKLLSEIQTATLYLNRPIKDFDLSKANYCLDTTSIFEAVNLLNEYNTNILLIKDSNENNLGIVTDYDIRKKSITRHFKLDDAVKKIMSAPIITISDSSLLFEAGLLMEKNKISHIFIINTENKIIGVMNRKDISAFQKYLPANLQWKIENAKSPEYIIEQNSIFPYLNATLINSGAKAEYINRYMTLNTDLILNKLIEFAIKELGPPPVKFVFLIFGSEGRHEQTLKTDQDNAILYQDVSDDQEKVVNAYFLKLSNKVCNWLDQAGYSFCEGNNMAKNPKWCQPLSIWKNYFSTWIDKANAKSLLKTNIFFDFRKAYGDDSLVTQLRSHLYKKTNKSPRFFQLLARNVLSLSPPIGFFGNFVLETKGKQRKAIDIKSAMTPIVDYARIYAIKHNIKATNTIERLNHLYELGILISQNHNEMVQAYSYLMQMRLRNQADAITKNIKPNNYISPRDLTYIKQKLLKEIFSQIKNFQTKLSYDFTGMKDAI
jgi:PAS domain S-box-containing protein